MCGGMIIHILVECYPSPPPNIESILDKRSLEEVLVFFTEEVLGEPSSADFSASKLPTVLLFSCTLPPLLEGYHWGMEFADKCRFAAHC